MREKIIRLATLLAQQYGLNAFSYNDLAKELGIAKASIHHYFPNKNDLAYEILRLYTIDFQSKLLTLKDLPVTEKLRGYVRIFSQVSNASNKICLCLMYATDLLSLEPRTQQLVQEFFLSNEAWLEAIFNKDSTEISRQKSQLLFSQLQGLLIRNRLLNNKNSFLLLENLIVDLYQP